ncbi:MAG: prolipoprotein diacylglyceryl transferase [Anaerolineae bacterium]|nr:prolipoprotein diacylglyceryl transferase [Anaerolineae bacterium]
MGPVPAFQIGPITVYWYGVIIVTGVLLGAYVASIEAKRRGLNPDHVWNGLLLCLILGIIGARLYHVFSSPRGGSLGWEYYRQNPAAIFRIWEGGLGIYGAVVGGILGLLIYSYVSKLNFLQWADLGALGLVLGQSVGRWANYVNKELYGYPTTLPWGITIPAEYRIIPFNDLTKYPLDTRFHPVFLYESLWNLAGFLLLFYISRKWAQRLLEGDIFFLYLIWYPLGRAMIESLRPDAWLLGNIPTAQVVSIITMVVSAAIMLIRHRLASTKVAPATEPAVEEEEPVDSGD